ncbi:deleted in malignant brain tumors 1 protein-like isoform X2 [Actinia tenebrosa]|uniref:Deleted in malignant brain tumors 1 protein-like isoform X2 n=1 Tax=Actinia tenebrosa TaxID=6105 RepID=A0A6P8HSE0_ACTTE|nr:deleted in malignant brain tumors 1 protein-like isoform X2 [Actinia tenebrosa]
MAHLQLLLCIVFLLVKVKGNKNDIAVRLMDGKTPNKGRVEVRYKGTWGTICNEEWDIWDAYVVCHMLNYSKAVTATTASVKGTAHIWLKELDCFGSQESIDQCRYVGWGNTGGCNHSRDAGVVCGNAIHVNVRLVNGKTPNEGRVEVRYNDTWGTICNDGYWDIQDAYVVCHMLNYSKAVTATTASIKGTGPIWLNGLGCLGYEESIDQCRHAGWGNTSGCDHSRDAGVICGNLTSEETAIEVRLVGDQNHTGKVEIKYNGTWGVVCDWSRWWDIRDAHVICRMLGYKAAEHAIRFIEGETPTRMLMYSVACNGREKSIAECYHLGWWSIHSWCSNKDLVGVVCQTNEDPPPVQVRLAGGRSAISGRLEVSYHGQWGTVCNVGWDMKDAEVVCRMLGYPGVQEYNTTNFTHVKGIIWLMFVGCTGREASIADCSHIGWGNTICYHSQDVGVTCKMASSSAPRFIVSGETHGSPYTTAMLVFNSSTTDKERNITKAFQITITKLEVSSLNCYRSSIKVNHSYVTAEILGSSLVGNFTIGDGNYYHGYYNVPLEPGSTYRVFVRTVITAHNGGNNYGEAANATFTTRVKTCIGYFWSKIGQNIFSTAYQNIHTY